ncbi:hypothetical protein FKM82_000786 [Ascaphus truei]
MAKWLNKYFSLNNNKTKSPPQPPRPDYKRNGTTDRPFNLQQQPFPQYHHHTSPLPGHCREESDLIRAYRAQKERDFEDPYNGPGSSLRKLRAMCREEQQGEGRRGSVRAPGCSSSNSILQDHYPGSSTNTTSSSSSSSSSPHLYRSNSERRPAGGRHQQLLQGGGSELKYVVSPKHRLIKIESCGWGETSTGAGSGGAGITWSPAATGGGSKTEQQSNPGGKKEKGHRGRRRAVIAVWGL